MNNLLPNIARQTSKRKGQFHEQNKYNACPK